MEQILGGITNELNMVFPILGEAKKVYSQLPPVVLRVYGQGTDRFLNRAVEAEALLELNAQGFGARCLGVFGNGRVEEAFINTRWGCTS